VVTVGIGGTPAPLQSAAALGPDFARAARREVNERWLICGGERARQSDNCHWLNAFKEPEATHLSCDFIVNRA